MSFRPTEILAAGASALSHTGNTNETSLVTYSLAANTLKVGGMIRITCLWSYTNSSNNKTLKVKFGSANPLNLTVTTTASLLRHVHVFQRGASSQTFFSVNNTTGVGVSAGAISTSAIDTTSAVTIDFTATLANAGETITLEYYLIEMTQP